MAGNSRVNSLKTKLGMGARPNKYRVLLTIPKAVGASIDGNTLDTICKGASIPEKIMGQIEAFSQGRKIILAGDAQFSNSWTLTFYDTENHKLRNAFTKWQEMIDDFENHSRGIKSHNDYMAEPEVHQLSTIDNKATAKYKFYNMFPVNVSNLELADETNDQLGEFTVEFAFSHFIRLDTYKPYGTDANPLN